MSTNKETAKVECEGECTGKCTGVLFTGVPLGVPADSLLPAAATLAACAGMQQTAEEVWKDITEAQEAADAIKLQRKFFVLDISDADLPELKAHNERVAEILRRNGIKNPEGPLNDHNDAFVTFAEEMAADTNTELKAILGAAQSTLEIDTANGEVTVTQNDTCITIGDDGLKITKPDGSKLQINGNDITFVDSTDEVEPMPEFENLDQVDISHYTPEIQERLKPYQKIFHGLDVAQIAVAINARAGKTVTPAAVSLAGIEFQLDLIKDELDEAYLALKQIKLGSSNTEENKAALNEFLDAAIGDILLCTLGLGARLPINPIQEYLNVCLTNLTRIPQTQEEAEATVAKFKELNINTEIKEGFNPDGTRTYPVLTPADGNVQQGLDGKAYQSNYFCKGVNTFLPTAYGLTEEVIFVE